MAEAQANKKETKKEIKLLNIEEIDFTNKDQKIKR
jgi:hypothetical protein